MLRTTLTRASWIAAVLAGLATSVAPLAASAQPLVDRMVVRAADEEAISSSRHVYRAADGSEGSRELAFYLYLPPGHDAAGPVPTVVFANGVGDSPEHEMYIAEWAAYQDWARLVASHGMAGVLYNSTSDNASGDTDALLTFLRENSSSLGLRDDRFCLWSSSANVDEVYGLAAGPDHREISCLAIFYGVPGDDAPIRADLPVFYVWSGFDRLPGNHMVEDWVGRAMRASVDLTLINYRGGFHGFDAFQPSQESRRLVMECVEFIERHLLAEPDPAMADALRLQHAKELFQARDFEAARPIFEDAVARDLYNAREWHYHLAWCAIQRGDREAALEHFVAAAERWFAPQLSYYNAACCAALLGDSERALELLDRAIGAGFRDPGTMSADEDLASIREDPRFAAMLERIQAPEPQ